ncbi:MAG: chemotaxis protein CheW [Pseudomonadota bacterium]
MTKANSTHAGLIDGDGAATYAGNQYLTFLLAGEEYGVEILRVQEIKGWESATPIPNTPSYVLGVLNLRGAVVPIIDLRKRFDMESVDYGPTTVIIVVKIRADETERTVGLVVDGVADVYRLEDETIQPPPNMGNDMKTESIRGLATVEEKMVILLEVDSLMNIDETGIDKNGANDSIVAGQETAVTETAIAS